MSNQPPFANRRTTMLDRIVALFSTDPRFRAGWLEGSLADGSGDDYSDIDLHLCIADDSWDEVWKQHREIIETIAPILVSNDIMGTFATAFLMMAPIGSLSTR